MMTVPPWADLEALFHEALAPPPAERAAFLAERCAGRPDLQTEVDAMLRAHDAAKTGNIWSLTTQLSLKAGARLGVYEVLGQLGSGGMGEVYRARDGKLGRDVAIKILPVIFASDRDRLARLEREARALAALNHPHVLTVHDAGEFEGRQYLVTELIDGGTLREWAARQRHELHSTLELLTGVADGLATAHEAGILHRDIKPENILITRRGDAKLADFGLAKLQERATPDDATRAATENRTRPGVVVGTVAYMSPEQALGRPLDARSDIFSFGVVLYELLAGRRPFGGESHVDVLHAIVHGAVEPLPDEVPSPLRTVVEKALERDPADRYQSMREMVVDLRRLTRQTLVAARPTRTLWRWAAALVVVAAAMALSLQFWSRPVLPGIRSIAVLPFSNLSGGPDQEIFSDGTTEALISSLSKIHALAVTSRTSAMRYKATTKSLRDIGRELGVDALVVGSVQRSGGRVRITAQLVQASTDANLWANERTRFGR